MKRRLAAAGVHEVNSTGSLPNGDAGILFAAVRHPPEHIAYKRRELRDIERLLRQNLELLRDKWDEFCNPSDDAAQAKVASVCVTDDTLSVDLEDGRSVAVPIGWYPRLAHASPEERSHFLISGAGYGVHWPDLDEDIGVEGLLLGKKSTESRVSFERWLQQRPTR